LDYQWNDVVIPFWQDYSGFAKQYGVTRFALEMHPGFVVYNADTLLRLRAAVGDSIGANLDPSHLFWQGAEMPAVIRALGDAIYFFHAKDTKVDPINTARAGVLDTKHYSDEINRSWIFRSVGYGHDAQTWKDIVSNLRMVGYDDIMSIEHEDSLLTPKEGLEKAITFLNDVMAFQPRGAMFWA
jgi:sugar phosphate isomerase/epimerase